MDKKNNKRLKSMKVEKIDLKHQAILDEAFKKLNIKLVEYSFSNCYLFRREHDFEVVQNGHLYVRGKTHDGRRYLMPTQRLRDLPLHELSECMHDIEFLYPIPDEWMGDLSPALIESATYIEADSDYLFTLDKIQHYPGRYLSGKRNLVHQFVDQYDYSSFPLSPDRKNDAQIVLDTWQSQMHEEKSENDYYACQDALGLINQLKLSGKIYYIDNKPVGFALGNPISEETYDLHFVKADKNFKGIYQFINQDFAQSLNGKLVYINFEQDLGNPALHQSKSSYGPDQLLVKRRVRLNLHRLMAEH